ncbi:hypothetical protein [Thalassobellus citreus]|uniref:hypothetical protein n=1 Tax=Thalassobellus citreus TaxID=3367752 RepID=UPI003798104D
MSKTNHLQTLLCIGLFALTFGTIQSQNEMTINHQKKSNMETMKMTSQSHTLKLKKGELFLIISSITKPGAQNLMNDYFEKVFPIASKNGFKPLASLPIDKVVAGNYKPNNFVGLYSWPSMDAVQAFLMELPNSELTTMRKKIWNELKQVIVSVEMDFEITLHEAKVYEIQTIWNDNQIKEDLKNFNGNIIFNLPITGYEDLNNGKKPTQTILIEWDSKKDANAYRTRKKPIIEESFITHLQLPEQKQD